MDEITDPPVDLNPEETELLAEYLLRQDFEDDGYEAARRLLALDPRPDGIFGYNDPTAAGAMKAILEAAPAFPSGGWFPNSPKLSLGS